MSAPAILRTGGFEQGRLPRPLQSVRIGLIALVVCHLIVPLVMLVAHGRVADGIRDANPGFSPDKVHTTLLITLISGTLFHLLFVVLYIWLQDRLRTGKPRIRRIVTVGMVMATIGSAVSYSSSPLFRDVIPVMDAVQLAIIALIWLPASSRLWFDGRRRELA